MVRSAASIRAGKERAKKNRPDGGITTARMRGCLAAYSCSNAFFQPQPSQTVEPTVAKWDHGGDIG
ncbi:hypothetical protein BT67DRAFT_9029 [Trichocladium antarcticum]|uniref:Uncharacterized protein n=1 Tax=Trichocladium antarcticum TaxID=1450529 RepID=A0AAN6ZGM6_9PEZI|nr:hypothetical protein BT67DRAFT_9029 [Trichocladium antarcticum]